MMTTFYQQNELVENLWLEFIKTPEYKCSFSLVAIPQDHPIIIRREEEGLKMVVQKIRDDLANCKHIYVDQLRKRHPGDWQREWLQMHDLLFKRVLKKRGCLRDGDVWFDTLEATEQLYKIPPAGLVGARLAELTEEVHYLFTKDYESLEKKLLLMARIHFQFICVHPFADGNGRIGRIIIDQICLAFGLPTAMGGYPRTDKIQRRDYHAAIRECGENLNFEKLAKWIGRKIEINAQQIG